VDDLDGDGALQLLVSTMNGNVYCLDTRTPYHPLKTWSAQVQGLNGQVARWNHFGIYAGLVSRQPRDVAGQKLQVGYGREQTVSVVCTCVRVCSDWQTMHGE
jgi:hypothetical protein